MSADSIPIWAIFVGTFGLVLGCVYLGWKLGTSARRHWDDEKESSVSGVSAAVLGMTAFMMVFTFGIVADRYDARRQLVREDANAIRTAYQRASFLPEPEQAESKALLRRHLALRLQVAHDNQVEPFAATQRESDQIQRRLWDIAAANAGRDMNSDVAALYAESLNTVFDVHASRVAVAIQARIPIAVWLILYTLTILGMISMGYQAGVVGSKWSRSTLILAVAFALMNTVIASLDRPGGSRVTQMPLENLQRYIASER